jgi:hypothetical protein
MYLIESSLCKNDNYFLHCFPIQILEKFIKELRSVLSYSYLLQSSIDYSSQLRTFVEQRIVYRRFSSDDPILVQLYESLVGEVIILRRFIRTSINFNVVIKIFIQNADRIMFEIEFHHSKVAINIACYSDNPIESIFLIVVSSMFRIVWIEEIQIRNEISDDFTISRVKLSYFVY